MKQAQLFRITLIIILLINFSKADANWIKKFGDWVSKAWKPVHGQYSEGGSTNRASPLTTFDRRSDIYIIQRESIKKQVLLGINDPTNYFQIYQKIYSNANNGNSSIKCEGADQGTCAAAVLAKNAAFVYLMGFDENGDDLDTPERNGFYNKAVFILRKCNDEDRYGSFSGKETQHYRAEELIMLLQAHDYLMMAKAAGLAYDDGDCEDAKESLADFTYDLYSRSNNIGGALDAYNNITLKVAGAVGMAAVVLSDQGTYFWRVQKKPERWANAAHAYINRTLWTGPGAWPITGSEGAMSSNGSISGYGEGPHYFAYSMDNLLPFFTSFDNFVNRDMTGKYYTSALNFSAEEVRNYKYNTSLDSLYTWYNSIRMPNFILPSYDDTWSDASTGTLALTRKPEHNVVSNFDQLKIGNREADYLASFNPPSIPNFPKSLVYHTAGDIVVRTSWVTPLRYAHYLHVNGEQGTALNGHRNALWYDYGHEHGDAGSFIIAAGEDVLAMDPAYTGFDNRAEVSLGHQHNVITIDGDGPDPDQESFVDLKQDGDNYLAKVETTFKGLLGDDVAKQKREIEVINDWTTPFPYYVINDYVTSKESSSIWVQFNLNGNGLSTADTPSFFIEPGKDNVAVWNHPCYKDAFKGDNWKMRATLTTQIQNQSTSNSWSAQNGSTHGNNKINYSGSASSTENNAIFPNKGNITDWHPRNGYENYGEHTRATKQLSILENEVAHFKVTIEVLGCLDDTTASPKFVQTPKHTGHMVQRGDASGKVFNFHYSRAVNDNGFDTVINPLFFEGSSAVFGTDSRRAFYSRAENPELRNGFCVTSAYFRKAGVTEGQTLEYDDTVYISSDKIVSTQYDITGKWQYRGYCTTTDAAQITYYLPDVQQGMEMTAVGNTAISYTYDTLTRIMTVNFPASSTTNFTFRLTDPCKLSCFYPDSLTNVVSTFTHGDGSTQPLGHRLRILQPDGRLNIYDGSKMSICSNKYLVNRDSLFLLSTQEPSTSLSRCTPWVMGQQVEQSNRSAIIVNDRASLVLDSGSYTYVGANATIYVKKGGTLLIKKDAFVEIGSEEKPGRGEIIAEDGAYVCIQDSAHVQFYADGSDTTDKNLFYVVLQNQTMPQVVERTHAGVNTNIVQLLLGDTLIKPQSTCFEFCDLDSIMPPWGIYNREWGYAPFVFPLSTFKLTGDTLCPGDSVVIHLTRLLNERGYQINVCRVPDPASPGGTTCVTGDTNAIHINTLQGGGDLCVERSETPQDLRFRFWDTGWYKVNVSTTNECGSTHDSTQYVYVPADPEVFITMPDSSCPGYSTVIADGSASISHLNHNEHHWTVVLIQPDSFAVTGDTINYGGDWEYDSSGVSDSFDFPGFRWIGGFKYAVGLSVKGWCGDVTRWDTVSIPLMVIADADITLAYKNPVGPAALQLHGYVIGADSFKWSPTTNLTNPTSLNPVATPSTAVSYVLTGYLQGCTNRDTIKVSRNQIAFTGTDTSICYDKCIVLGTTFNAAILLGYLNYSSNGIFSGIYASYGGLRFDKHFTRFIIRNLGSYTSTPLISTFINIDSIRNQIQKRPWFVDYYNSFLGSTASISSLNAFVTYVNGDSLMKSLFNVNSVKAKWNATTVTQILTAYRSYYNSAQYNRAHTVWEQRYDTSNTWIASTADADFFNMPICDPDNKFYRITVTDSDVGTVEYDDVFVNEDTIPVPMFTIAYQLDSTLYFTNYTEPDRGWNKYKWTFGDGTISTYKNPSHTFPAFDSTYIVCLIAMNQCDTLKYCDTLTVDSSGLMYEGFGKTGIAVQPLVKHQSDETQVATNTIPGHYLSVNVPNPFSETTVVQYAIAGEYRRAEIRIVSALGHLQRQYTLSNARGSLQIDAAGLAAGMYFYTLLIDGVVYQSKAMMIER